MNLLTSNWIIFFPLACTLFVAQRMSQGSDRGQAHWSMVALTGLIQLMLCFSLLGFAVRWNWLSLLVAPILLIFMFVLFWRKRRLERTSLLATTSMSQRPEERQRLLQLIMQENRGYLRRKAGQLSQDVHSASAWGWVLEKHGVARGAAEKISLRLQHMFGFSKQQWGRQVHSWKLNLPLTIEAQAERLLGRLMVLLSSFPLMILLYVFMVFVLPTLNGVSQELGAEPTLFSEVAMFVEMSWYGGNWGFLLGFIPLSMLLVLGLFVLGWLFPGALQAQPMRWLFADYFRALGFNTFAFVMDKESNLALASSRTAAALPIGYLSSAFASVASRLEDGMDVAQAFRKSGLVNSAEEKVLREADSEPAFALEQIANWKVERMLMRYGIIVQVVVVLVTLMWAVVVGGFAYLLFESLSNMVLSAGGKP